MNNLNEKFVLHHVSTDCVNRLISDMNRDLNKVTLSHLLLINSIDQIIENCCKSQQFNMEIKWHIMAEPKHPQEDNSFSYWKKNQV